jgi:hypothetical protein
VGVRLLLIAAACLLFAFLRFASLELFTRRAAGVLEGTVTSDSSELTQTGRARVKLDTGPEIQVANAIGDYPTGTRVNVQVLKSPVLGRLSYELAFAQTNGPTFDNPPVPR